MIYTATHRKPAISWQRGRTSLKRFGPGLSRLQARKDSDFKSEHVVEDEAVIKALRALGYF